MIEVTLKFSNLSEAQDALNLLGGKSNPIKEAPVAAPIAAPPTPAPVETQAPAPAAQPGS